MGLFGRCVQRYILPSASGTLIIIIRKKGGEPPTPSLSLICQESHKERVGGCALRAIYLFFAVLIRRILGFPVATPPDVRRGSHTVLRRGIREGVHSVHASGALACTSPRDCVLGVLFLQCVIFEGLLLWNSRGHPVLCDRKVREASGPAVVCWEEKGPQAVVGLCKNGERHRL